MRPISGRIGPPAGSVDAAEPVADQLDGALGLVGPDEVTGAGDHLEAGIIELTLPRTNGNLNQLEAIPGSAFEVVQSEAAAESC